MSILEIFDLHFYDGFHIVAVGVGDDRWFIDVVYSEVGGLYHSCFLGGHAAGGEQTCDDYANDSNVLRFHNCRVFRV